MRREQYIGEAKQSRLVRATRISKVLSHGCNFWPRISLAVLQLTHTQQIRPCFWSDYISFFGYVQKTFNQHAYREMHFKVCYKMCVSNEMRMNKGTVLQQSRG